MFAFLQDFLLNQELKKVNSSKQFVEWAKVKSICIVLPNDSASLSAAQKFANESGKLVDVILFCNDKLTVNTAVSASFNRKDFTFLGLPKVETITKLKVKNYDIIICGDLSGMINLKALSLLVPSKCRVGVAELDYSKEFDISISGQNTSISDFLTQALKYLTMIKSA